MAESVRFIFKTLIKIPIIIFVAYFILNIFSFAFIYFRMLGISYVVMQTSVENNYIPKQEANTITDYLRDTAKISMVRNVGVIFGDDSTVATASVATDCKTVVDGKTFVFVKIDGDNDVADEQQLINSFDGLGAFRRRQYGANIVCGVYCDYEIIWPLDYRADRNNIKADGTYTYEDVDGYRGTTQSHNNYINSFARLPITITYKVPGLKYYPDLGV